MRCPHYLRRDGPRHLGKEAQHGLRERLVGNIVLQQQDLLLRVLFPSLPKTAHKVTLAGRRRDVCTLLSGVACCLDTSSYQDIKVRDASNSHLGIWNVWASHRWPP